MRQRIQPRSTNHPFGLIPIFELVKASDREWIVRLSGFKIGSLRVDVRERAMKGPLVRDET